MTPLHLSGFAIAGIFVLLALAAIGITWAICVVADEWENAEWHGDDLERDK